MKRLEGLYIDEAMRASAHSMSRELAQLASYFQLVFLSPEQQQQHQPASSASFDWEGGGSGCGATPTLLNKGLLASKPRPAAPNLRESLRELNQFSPLQMTTATQPTPPEAPHPAHPSTKSALIKGLGGIFPKNQQNM